MRWNDRSKTAGWGPCEPLLSSRLGVWHGQAPTPRQPDGSRLQSHGGSRRTFRVPSWPLCSSSFPFVSRARVPIPLTPLQATPHLTCGYHRCHTHKHISCVSCCCSSCCQSLGQVLNGRRPRDPASARGHQGSTGAAGQPADEPVFSGSHPLAARSIARLTSRSAAAVSAMRFACFVSLSLTTQRNPPQGPVGGAHASTSSPFA